MRFAFYIEQDVSRLDVAMQNTVFMRVMHRACYFCDKFQGLPDRDRCVFNYLVKLTAFDQLHAEVALTIALAHLVDGHNAWMIKACGGFCFQTKAPKVRWRSPLTESNDF